MSVTGLPKNQIRSRGTLEQHEDSASARRVLLVDQDGKNIDLANPLAVRLSDGSISIDTLNADLQVQLSAFPSAQHPVADSVQVGGPNGNVIEPNADGSINVNVLPSSNAKVISQFGEALAVASGALTVLLTYTMPPTKSGYLERINVSGENIAKYDVYLNGSKIDTRRTYFGASLNEFFDFLSSSGDGLPLISGDIVSVKVLHNRPLTGDFEARAQVLEIS